MPCSDSSLMFVKSEVSYIFWLNNNKKVCDKFLFKIHLQTIVQFCTHCLLSALRYIFFQNFYASETLQCISGCNTQLSHTHAFSLGLCEEKFPIHILSFSVGPVSFSLKWIHDVCIFLCPSLF